MTMLEPREWHVPREMSVGLGREILDRMNKKEDPGMSDPELEQQPKQGRYLFEVVVYAHSVEEALKWLEDEGWPVNDTREVIYKGQIGERGEDN